MKNQTFYAYPPSVRARVFRLRKLGYTYNRIAEDTQVSEATVYNWMKEERLGKNRSGTKTVKATRRKTSK